MMKRLPASFIPLLLCFGLIATLALVLVNNKPEGNKFALHIGETVNPTRLPVFEAPAETRFDTSDWAGRPYIVNFFASWCVPCQAEHEILSALQNHFHLPIIGIAFKDKPETLRRFLSRSGNPYLAVGMDADGRAGIDWGLTGVPETFIIDAHGIIRYHFVGPMTGEVVTEALLPIWKTVTGEFAKP